MPPLSGCVVVDMTSFVSGPFASMVLGDLGADVIKVEHPPLGDPNRNREADTGYSPSFVAINRNKRSILLDARTREGRSRLDALIRTADVLLTNLRPSTQQRLGIDASTARRLNPRLIHAGISGIGESGDSRDVPAFDTTAAAQSGLFDLLGARCDEPLFNKVFLADQLAGLYVVIGILAALEQRHRTGTGEEVRTSLLRAAAAFTIISQSQELNASNDSVHGRGPRTPAFLVLAADGKGVALHIPPAPEKMWSNFVAAFDAPDLAGNPKYATKELRVENYDELLSDVSRHMKTKTRAEWLEIFARNDVPVAPYNPASEVADDAAVIRDRIVVEYADPANNVVRSVGPGVLVGLDSFPLTRAPLLGEHTAAVDAEIDRP